VAVEDVGGEFHGASHGNAASLVERNVERNGQGKCPVWFRLGHPAMSAYGA
jgi:hypothetical protein